MSLRAPPPTEGQMDRLRGDVSAALSRAAEPFAGCGMYPAHNQLVAWLVRLVTPGGGRVLDPFAGTGTTGVACLREGREAVLVELEAESVAQCRLRLDHLAGRAPLTGQLKARRKPQAPSAGPLFDVGGGGE